MLKYYKIIEVLQVTAAWKQNLQGKINKNKTFELNSS